MLDEQNKKYHAEFVISYSHRQQIYQPVSISNSLSIANQTAIEIHYLPGSEWLYFEIFINPSKSNFFLRNEIQQLIKMHKSDITKWFFIRYNENGDHLRLRLQVKNSAKRLDIIDHFNALIKEQITNGIVKDVAIKTYRCELARYGPTRMASIEQFFYLDSKHVLSLLSKTTHKNKLYQQTINFIYQITSICFPLFNDRLQFARQLAEAFSNEFNINKEGFKKINHAYSSLKNNEDQVSNLKQLENQARVIFMKCAEGEKSRLLADLIHMHVNRVFANQQRLHEAICYQFLHKQLLTKRARLAVRVECQASA